MKNQQIMENNKKSVVLTMTGTAIMIFLRQGILPQETQELYSMMLPLYSLTV